MIPELPPGGPTVFAGRYRIERPLGRGSFGRTMLAHDEAAGRSVAIKLLDPRGSADWKAHELFEREAAVLRTLRHQGVPEMHDLVRDTWDGNPVVALVMEYVDGVSIAEVIERQGSMDAAAVVDLFLEMVGILEYLHTRVPPVLHRDIKPSNIIIRPDGRPALVDFGSVRHVFLSPDEAGSTVAGTYGYMPYEQYMGQSSPASDLYALAATFLHLLTLRPPRDWMSDQATIDVPASLPGDQRLRPILVRLLQASPANRYGSAKEVRQALLSVAVPIAPESGLASMPQVAGSASGVLPASGLKTSLVAPRVATLAPLPHAPRTLEGPTAALLDRLAPRMLEYMTGDARRDGVSVLEVGALVVFSVVTLGVAPAVFFTMARKRRRRLRHFLERGTPAIAQIIGIRLEESAFAEKLALVSYQFEAAGTLHRGSDEVLPHFSNRWQAGDSIEILYVLEDDVDSVIISTK